MSRLNTLETSPKLKSISCLQSHLALHTFTCESAEINTSWMCTAVCEQCIFYVHGSKLKEVLR